MNLPQLLDVGSDYVLEVSKTAAGLVFRPSLAENATNPFALQEERLVHLGFVKIGCHIDPTNGGRWYV